MKVEHLTIREWFPFCYHVPGIHHGLRLRGNSKDRTERAVVLLHKRLTSHTVVAPQEVFRVILLLDRKNPGIVWSPKCPLPVGFPRVSLQLTVSIVFRL
jgi:hypothetical protein